MKSKQDGYISISRVSTNSEPWGFVRITLTDKNWNQYLTVDVPLLEFANIITGIANQKCEITEIKKD
jgi:hypothetical protein